MERNAREYGATELTDAEKRELKPIEKIKMVMTRDKDDEKTLYDLPAWHKGISQK
ncbi:MAG: hypothetical protein U0V48_16710 [Anaerolineales bacterium]